MDSQLVASSEWVSEWVSVWLSDWRVTCVSRHVTVNESVTTVCMYAMYACVLVSQPCGSQCQSVTQTHAVCVLQLTQSHQNTFHPTQVTLNFSSRHPLEWKNESQNAERMEWGFGNYRHFLATKLCLSGKSASRPATVYKPMQVEQNEQRMMCMMWCRAWYLKWAQGRLNDMAKSK